MEQPVPPNCPICGKLTEPLWKSCPFCGFSFQKRQAQKVEPPKFSPKVSSQAVIKPEQKGMPIWGWLLIILGGGGCIITILVLLAGTGVFLLNRGSTSNSENIPTEAVTIYHEPSPNDQVPENSPPVFNGADPSMGMITVVPDQDVREVEIVDKWFVEDSSGSRIMTFGCIIKNPNPYVALTNLELQAVAYDAGGGILATGNTYIYVLLPDDEVAVGSTFGMTIPEGNTVDHIEFKVTDQGSAATFPFSNNPFSFSDIVFYEDENNPIVTGFVQNQMDLSFGGVMINAIALDSAGKVIGGSSNYNDTYVPAKGRIPITLDMSTKGEVANVKLYATFNVGMEVYEDAESELPIMVASGVSVDDYGTVRYTAIIENPSIEQIYQYLPGRIVFFDTTGKVIGSTYAQIDTIFPGDRIAISSSTMLPHMQGKYQIGKIEFYPNRPTSNYEMDRLVNAGITENPLSIDQVQSFTGEYETKITAMLKNSYEKSIQGKVVAVLYDSSGKIIGGGEGYPPVVPGNDEVAVEISIYQPLSPAKLEVYASMSGFPQD